MSGQNIWDAIVIGSGAAGLTAAITAAQHGLSVLVVEKTSWFGGTTALSGGGIWIPANPHAAAAGISDSTQAARAYIAALVGNKLLADMLDSYLQAGPEMLNFLEAKSEVRFAIAPHSPDWFFVFRGTGSVPRHGAALDECRGAEELAAQAGGR